MFTGNWDKAWNGIKDMFGGFGDAIKGIFSGLWNVIKDIFSGAVNWIKAGLSSWGNNLSNIWNNLWSGIKNAAVNIWNGIKTAISNVINGIKNTISNVLNGIKNVWNSIWNGLKTTVSNVFNGIWNTIRKVANSILGGIEGMVNGIIRGINAMIRALNKVKFDIPNWIPGLGGKSFGFNLGQLNTVSLPRLAEGGYFKANQPTLAMVGDNKTQSEIVSPVDKMQDALRSVLAEQNTNGKSEIIEILKEIVQILVNLDFDANLYIDGYELNRRIEKIKNKNKFATNGG